MIGKDIKRIVQGWLGILLILSVIQIMPFGLIVENVSAGSSWVQTTDTDFSNGTLENLIINGSGTNAEVRLIKDGLEREYTVDGNTVALWHFNETSGSTAYDETSYNNDGTIYGATRVEGKFGNGLQFNGTDDYVKVPDSTSWDITDAITIEAWVNGSGADFSAKKRTTSAYNKENPQLQVVGNKIYYVWQGYDGSSNQIWTAEMNTDGTGFSAIKRTTSTYLKYDPQLQVVGSKIYFVWCEFGGSNYQIWTAEMNIDGTGFSAIERTTSTYFKWYPQLQVVGSKIYYVWFEWDGSYNQVWTAEMNTDGTSFSATKRTTSAYSKYGPQLQVVGNKIYYVWSEDDGSYQIWTAEMNTDGTGFSATKRTISAYTKHDPQLQVVGSKIYFVWHEPDSSNRQIWTAEMRTDGTGFSATKRTTSSYHKYNPQFQVVGSKIYYVWYEDNQIWNAEMNTNGTDFSATKRTTSAYSKEGPQLQIVGSKIYYAWQENDGSYDQIWTGEMNSNIVNKGDFYGLGISNNTIKGFINAGLDGFKYNAEAINDTAGATVESTIDSNWNHITMTYDKSNLKLYVNGVLVDTSAFTEPVNTNPFDLIIGDDFNGTMDETRISSIARIPGFFPTGTLTSSILDTGSNSNFTTISWNPTSQPLNTNLKFQIATNSDASTWNFFGPDGTSNTNYTIASGQSIWSGHKGDRYLKYKAYLSTTNGSVTPTLQDVTINFNCIPYVPTLSGPPNNMWTNNNTPIFNWTFNDLDGTQSGFQVLIDDDSGFGSVDYDSGERSSSNEYWQFPTGTSYTTIVDGTWYWKVRTQDNDGDWGAYSSPWVVKIDAKGPMVTISSTTHIEEEWSNNNDPSFNWTFLDSFPSSGIAGYSYMLDNSPSTLPDPSINDTVNSKSYTNLSDNTYYFHVRAIDNASNWGDSDHYGPIKIDTVQPISTITTPGDSSYLNSLNTISGTAFDTDGSGVSEVRISIKQNSNDTYWDGSRWIDLEFWLPTSGTTSWLKSTGLPAWENGSNYTIRSMATDNATNVETPGVGVTFMFDNQAPTSLSIIINNGDEYTSSPSVILSFNAEDSGSGIYQMAFSSDDVNWDDWEPYNTSKSYVLSGDDGSKTVYFRVEDKAGNIGQTVFDSIILDTTLPTVTSITLSDPSPTKAGNVTFTIIFSENMSTTINPIVTFGKTSPYDTHNIKQSSYSDNTWTGTFEIGATTGDGVNTISVSVAEDLAGNQIVLNASYTFIIDTIPPLVTDTLTGTDVEVTETLTITFSEPMNHTSVENSIIIFPKASISDYSWDGNALTITFSSDLNHGTAYTVTIFPSAEDLAGNVLEEPYSWQFTTKAEPEEGFPLLWLIILLIIIVIIVLLLAWVLMKRKSEELEEEEEEEEEIPPPPPKKAIIAELFEEGELEEAGEEVPPPPGKATIVELSEEEKEEEAEVEAPPPPKKAKPRKELPEEEMDRLPLPEPDEE